MSESKILVLGLAALVHVSGAIRILCSEERTETFSRSCSEAGISFPLGLIFWPFIVLSGGR
jgi:hypothetical protein